MPDDAQPKRLVPLPVKDWSDDLAPVLADMHGAPLNVHKLMAHNPVLLNAWWSFRNHSVNGGTLGRRLGELIILRVAVHLDAWYEWASHVDRSLRIGLTAEEICRVAERETCHGWSSAEAAVLEAVDDLMETRRLSPPTRARLAAHFSEEQLLDLIAIQGMYVILGNMILSWGLELDAGISARIAAITSEEEFSIRARAFATRQPKPN